MKKVLNNAKKIVIPSKKLQIEKTKIATLAFTLVAAQTPKHSQIVDVEFGGSYPKGTWLPQKADIDIFIKFKTSTSEKKFTEISQKVGFTALKKFKPYVRYSEHPYVEAMIHGTKVNVVPCYDVLPGKWKSSADRSSFHTKFMLESLTGQMKDDVRLLKEFLKCNGIYGAEIAKQGFSGYVCEVLVWNFGSFEEVIKKFAKIKPGQVIGKASKKFDTPITIMDPIDSNRNLAAAISGENIGKFVLVCRAFLKKPTGSFFKKKAKTVSAKDLKNVLLVKFRYRARSPDIIWGQLKRAASSLATQMQKEDFEVLRNGAYTDEKKDAYLIFSLKSIQIDENVIREGPMYFSESDSAKFLAKNSSKSLILWINGKGKILSLQKRKTNDASKFLHDLLKNHLTKSGVPKGLSGDFKKGFKIIAGAKISDKSIKEAIAELVTTDVTIFSSNK